MKAILWVTPDGHNYNWQKTHCLRGIIEINLSKINEIFNQKYSVLDIM